MGQLPISSSSPQSGQIVIFTAVPLIYTAFAKLCKAVLTPRPPPAAGLPGPDDLAVRAPRSRLADVFTQRSRVGGEPPAGATVSGARAPGGRRTGFGPAAAGERAHNGGNLGFAHGLRGEFAFEFPDSLLDQPKPLFKSRYRRDHATDAEFHSPRPSVEGGKNSRLRIVGCLGNMVFEPLFQRIKAAVKHVFETRLHRSEASADGIESVFNQIYLGVKTPIHHLEAPVYRVKPLIYGLETPIDSPEPLLQVLL
jgi:hypothetical protein